jgi:hypothetical protein
MPDDSFYRRWLTIDHTWRMASALPLQILVDLLEGLEPKMEVYRALCTFDRETSFPREPNSWKAEISPVLSKALFCRGSCPSAEMVYEAAVEDINAGALSVERVTASVEGVPAGGPALQLAVAGMVSTPEIYWFNPSLFAGWASSKGWDVPAGFRAALPVSGQTADGAVDLEGCVGLHAAATIDLPAAPGLEECVGLHAIASFDGGANPAAVADQTTRDPRAATCAIFATQPDQASDSLSSESPPTPASLIIRFRDRELAEVTLGTKKEIISRKIIQVRGRAWGALIAIAQTRGDVPWGRGPEVRKGIGELNAALKRRYGFESDLITRDPKGQRWVASFTCSPPHDGFPKAPSATAGVLELDDDGVGHGNRWPRRRRSSDEE